jgi:hypothetical protein
MLGPLLLALALGGAPDPLTPLTLSLEARGGALEAALGGGGVPGDWGRCEHFFVRSGGGQLNLAPRLLAGRAAVPTPPGAGELHLCGLDLEPYEQLVPAAPWSAFLTGHGLDAAVDAPARVRRTESAKALWRPGPGPPCAVALAKTGQAVELRPVADPTTLAAFGDLPLRGYAPGGAAGGRLRAVHQETGDVRTGTLDAEGLGHLSLGLAGRWTITLTVVRALEDGVWSLATASLTFTTEGERR